MYPLERIGELLLDHLQQQTTPIKEYDLIQRLDEDNVFAAAADLSISLSFVHKHFVTMHCLYRLQQQVFPQRLDISPLAIVLYSPEETKEGQTDVAEYMGTLSQFYLDLKHLDEATDDSVGDLLNQFWQRFEAHINADDAFAVLELTEAADWNQVKQAYRQRVQTLHPDKGGDKESFTRVLAAYETLKRRFNLLGTILQKPRDKIAADDR